MVTGRAAERQMCFAIRRIPEGCDVLLRWPLLRQRSQCESQRATREPRLASAKRGWLSSHSESGFKHLVNDFASDVRQSVISFLMAEGQRLVIQAECVQHRGL